MEGRYDWDWLHDSGALYSGVVETDDDGNLIIDGKYIPRQLVPGDEEE